MTNMNTDLSIDVNDAWGPYKDRFHLTDPSISSGSVTCYFRNIKSHLIDEIKKYSAVVGCVAWLTDVDILQELSKKKGVSIIVQKEDFLRPDSGDWSKQKLLKLYEKIPCMDKLCLPPPICDASICGDPSIGIKCVGEANINKKMASPRAHHKFIVLGHIVSFEDKEKDYYTEDFFPEAVWTGSFNFTNNGSNSLENAVVIKDKAIAKAYLNEFSQVAAMSEPLDWRSEWASPEYRIGT